MSPYFNFPLPTAASSSRFAPPEVSLHHESMNSRLLVKKLRVASLRRHDSQPLQTLFALVRKSSLPIVHTGFVQRGLPRSSPKNAAAPLYHNMLDDARRSSVFAARTFHLRFLVVAGAASSAR